MVSDLQTKGMWPAGGPAATLQHFTAEGERLKGLCDRLAATSDEVAAEMAAAAEAAEGGGDAMDVEMEGSATGSGMGAAAGSSAPDAKEALLSKFDSSLAGLGSTSQAVEKAAQRLGGGGGGKGGTH